MKVMNFIRVYEINEKEVEDRSITIASHWNSKDLVCLSLDNEEVIAVDANELIKAIQNATNH